MVGNMTDMKKLVRKIHQMPKPAGHSDRNRDKDDVRDAIGTHEFAGIDVAH